MKRLTFNLIAIALVLGMAQCKKEKPQNQPQTVTITLDVEGSNDNSNAKINVNPANGKVNFETGDQILVGYNGAYVGTLTHNGTNFTGPITIAQSGGKPLYFYFLGNKTPETTLQSGSTPTCRVDISDQSSELPVISMGHSIDAVSGKTVYYYPETSSYTAHLRNQCALVKFNVSSVSATASPTCITGFNNMVTVNFVYNTVTPSMEGVGEIRLPANTTSGEHWAILLPQAAMEEKMAFSEDGLCYGTQGAVPTITNNAYLSDGIAVTLDKTRQLINGAVNGLFTVNSSGKQVRFSMGNLQYIGSAGNGDADNTGAYWQFAPVQWEVLGILTGQGTDKKQVDRDLFGWGTSGWNSGNTYYRPWDTDSSDPTLYGPPGPGIIYLTGIYANADWGVYNAIRNGGNQAGQWRTLTRDEWVWVLGPDPSINPNPGINCRSGIRFAKATVNGLVGLIILPDGWSSTSLIETNNYNAAYTTNQITGEDWMDEFEPNGAVFLPATGLRAGGTYIFVDDAGHYWAALGGGQVGGAVAFDGSTLYPQTGYGRSGGLSVRLVKDN